MSIISIKLYIDISSSAVFEIDTNIARYLSGIMSITAWSFSINVH
jgi:hypothetical protein